ncbi:4-hydroxyphenylacetate 3-hydroxylase family protein [Ancylobacter sp. SL191]|uniref:4-hydroxyphenylacetate 3-hydroxylase family protein n=1 Tax=Ancylobacter sp. SL191 TaxID=2995166 RepID=UPI0022717F24|nr:4-hydroxyphenylacetate 3-hydroxylase N-terminal domain-containing protein [Ancylobacter sp. SL191]WAC27707.1 4-hydroxyphenylacetate 3-monooxygenase [Ancylobacter sp. SL191]
MSKSAESHLRSLNDGRCIYIDGGRVENVAEHPAFRNAAGSVARLYDFQARPENIEKMTIAAGNGARVSRTWQLPTSYDELVARREALVAWAELHHGFMGRSPDHVGSTLAGMYMGLDVYAAHPGGRPGVVSDYYRYASENDLYISYVIIDPQGDRSRATSSEGNADLAVAIVDEDAGGITVRGAKMLGTGAVLSNEVLVTTLRPLKDDEGRYAFTAAVPMNLPGIKLLSRRSYEGAVSSSFDYPLSSRFDENDALLYFDDVKIPWDRVFVHRDTRAQLAQWHDTPAHAYQNYQAEIRLLVKLRFLVGLARKITETIGTVNFPQVRETLGELAGHVGMIEAFVYGMEAKGRHRGPYFLPDAGLIYAAQVQSQLLYPKIIHFLRELSGGGVLMLPSCVGDFDHPDIAPLIKRTQYSPSLSSPERVKLFKLAWDAVGSEFASRHAQYEMFYSGPRTVTTGMAFRTFDWDRATGAVDAMLGSYDTPAMASPAPVTTPLAALAR